MRRVRSKGRAPAVVRLDVSSRRRRAPCGGVRERIPFAPPNGTPMRVRKAARAYLVPLLALLGTMALLGTAQASPVRDATVPEDCGPAWAGANRTEGPKDGSGHGDDVSPNRRTPNRRLGRKGAAIRGSANRTTRTRCGAVPGRKPVLTPRNGTAPTTGHRKLRGRRRVPPPRGQPGGHRAEAERGADAAGAGVTGRGLEPQSARAISAMPTVGKVFRRDAQDCGGPASRARFPACDRQRAWKWRSWRLPAGESATIGPPCTARPELIRWAREPARFEAQRAIGVQGAD